MKCSDYLAEFLSQIGVKRAYVLSGGMIAPLIDAIGRHPRLTLVNVAHEQAGGFCADAEARLTGVPGVALGTSGPGALNLVTTIATSYFDSVPTLLIGGQVQSYLRKGGRPLRQSALQECDFPRVVQPICKAVVTPAKGDALPGALADSYVQAVSGRPGPVVLDIPFDVQMGDCNVDRVTVPALPPPAGPAPSAIAAAADILTAAKRPLVLAGGGVRGARRACHDFVQGFRMPLAGTIAALDVLAAGDPLRIGMPGTYGTRAANMALAACDALLVLGSRLDHGVLGADPAGFTRRRSLIQVDVDQGELHARVNRHIAIESDCAPAIAALAAALAERGYATPQPWMQQLAELGDTFPDTGERPPSTAIDPNVFFARLGKKSQAAAVFCVDAGQHTWFCAQSLRLKAGQRLLSSTGLWAMGSAIPSAIGAALATGRPAVAIAGDGAVQLNIQDLATATRQRLPIKVIVLDNAAHGMVRQFQSEFLEGRHYGTVWDYSVPDLIRIFEGYGFAGRVIKQAAEIDAALDWLWADPAKPQVLRVAIDQSIDVSPSVPFGRQLHEMRPERAPDRR